MTVMVATSSPIFLSKPYTRGVNSRAIAMSSSSRSCTKTATSTTDATTPDNEASVRASVRGPADARTPIVTSMPPLFSARAGPEKLRFSWGVRDAGEGAQGHRRSQMGPGRLQIRRLARGPQSGGRVCPPQACRCSQRQASPSPATSQTRYDAVEVNTCQVERRGGRRGGAAEC